MIIDITVPLRSGLAVWPGEQGFDRKVVKSIADGDTATVSSLSMGAHTATHMDGPIHFVADTPGIDSIPLEALIGPAFVADLTHLTGAISADDLDSAVPPGTKRLLSKTRNSGWTNDPDFREDFCAYDATAAQWCVDNGILLVGIDYLSIEPFKSDGHPTHTTLLTGRIAVLEGVDLEGVEAGEWELIALPIPVVDGDGAPTRAVLRR